MWGRRWNDLVDLRADDAVLFAGCSRSGRSRPDDFWDVFSPERELAILLRYFQPFITKSFLGNFYLIKGLLQPGNAKNSQSHRKVCYTAQLDKHLWTRSRKHTFLHSVCISGLWKNSVINVEAIIRTTPVFVKSLSYCFIIALWNFFVFDYYCFKINGNYFREPYLGC